MAGGRDRQESAAGPGLSQNGDTMLLSAGPRSCDEIVYITRGGESDPPSHQGGGVQIIFNCIMHRQYNLQQPDTNPPTQPFFSVAKVESTRASVAQTRAPEGESPPYSDQFPREDIPGDAGDGE